MIEQACLQLLRGARRMQSLGACLSVMRGGGGVKLRARPWCEAEAESSCVLVSASGSPTSHTCSSLCTGAAMTLPMIEQACCGGSVVRCGGGV